MDRRQLITGLISLVAAPAIVRAGNLMPVKLVKPILDPNNLTSEQIRLLEGSGPLGFRVGDIISLLYDIDRKQMFYKVTAGDSDGGWVLSERLLTSRRV